MFLHDHGLFQLTAFRGWLDRRYRRIFEVSDANETRRFELYIGRDPKIGA